jgi:hypothetical protein
VARITRRRRARCKFSCEIVESSRRRVQGRVVTLSEGGLAVIAALPFEQGDSIQLLIKPGMGGKPVNVSAIVWNDRSSSKSEPGSKLRRFGCVISQPSRAYLELLDRIAPPPRRIDRVPVAVPARQDRSTDWVEPDLPRSRELQPPLKSEDEENLPYFRIRMKQIGGPRTRILTLRARSATQAETLAHDELGKVCSNPEGWSILHIARVLSDR